MTPPSTLRLSGIAATVVALVLMGANRTEHRVVRHEAPEARFVYAFGELGQARAELAEARQMEYVELATRIAMAADSVVRAARPAPAPKVRAMWHPHQAPVSPAPPESPAAGR